MLSDLKDFGLLDETSLAVAPLAFGTCASNANAQVCEPAKVV